MDGGRGGVKLEESGPASSWFFFSLHSFSMIKLKSNNSITSGLTTCGGCPGEPETVGTSYPFYSSYGPDRSCQTLSLCRLHSHTRRLISTMRAWTVSYR